jgi:hypothetical protein
MEENPYEPPRESGYDPPPAPSTNNFESPASDRLMLWVYALGAFVAIGWVLVFILRMLGLIH